MFDNTVTLFFGGTFWKLVNEDPNAIYFKNQFATEEERNAVGAQLVYQVEAEGAALLTNVNNALPLEKGAKVKNCILMQDTVVEDNASVEYVITDKDVTITEGKSLTGNDSFQVFVAKGQTV